MQVKTFVCKKKCQDHFQGDESCTLTVKDTDFVPLPEGCPYDEDTNPEWAEIDPTT